VKFKGQGAFEFLTLLGIRDPGTVIGVSYILAFNVPPFELTGTALIIVLCFLFRSLPVGVQAGHRRIQAARQEPRRSLGDAPRKHDDDDAPRRVPAAQAGRCRGARLQLRPLDDDGIGSDLPGHGGARAGHYVHRAARDQRRLWPRARVLHCADPDDAGVIGAMQWLIGERGWDAGRGTPCAGGDPVVQRDAPSSSQRSRI
jgi:hypothetical protein